MYSSFDVLADLGCKIDQEVTDKLSSLKLFVPDWQLGQHGSIVSTLDHQIYDVIMVILHILLLTSKWNGDGVNLILFLVFNVQIELDIAFLADLGNLGARLEMFDAMDVNGDGEAHLNQISSSDFCLCRRDLSNSSTHTHTTLESATRDQTHSRIKLFY